MKSIIKSIIKYIFLFGIGGGIYYGIETIWRGYSHWTMFVLGGICFITVGLINNIFTWKTPIEIQAIVGSIIITLLEFITGTIVNIKLDWNVWDYSRDIPYTSSDLLNFLYYPIYFDLLSGF